jgi:hypothetical protein
VTETPCRDGDALTKTWKNQRDTMLLNDRLPSLQGASRLIDEREAKRNCLLVAKL